MSPQPLSRVKPGIPVLFSPRAITERPTLSLMIAEAVATYADIEAQIALVLTRFLSAKADAALAMFEAITSAPAQIAAAKAAAATVLSEEDNTLFEAVLTVTADVARARHKLVHQQWGFSEELPDALLLADGKVNARFDMEVSGYLRDLAKGIVFGPTPNSPDDRIHVYKKKDFEEIIAKMRRVKECYYHLSFLHPDGLPPEPIRDWLYRQPDIREVLDRRKREDQKKQESPRG